jgi:xylulokinase
MIKFGVGMKTTIGLDVGTSAIKAILLDEDHRVLAESSCEIAINHPSDGYSEQSPDIWVSGVRRALSDLKHKAAEHYARCQAIGLSGQMHGAVLLGLDDNPLRPAILWNDNRAAQQAAQIQQSHPQLAWSAGVLCMSSFVAPKLQWIRQVEPETIKLLRHLVMPKDYVRLWLTGQHATDMVDAAGAWLLNQQERKWNSDILGALDIDERILPELYEGSEISGTIRQEIAQELGLNVGLPVIAGCGDAAAGSIGLGAINENDAFISLGTSCQFFVTRAKFEPQIDAAVHTYAHGLPGLWFQMAAMLNGASTLSWWSNITGTDTAALVKEVVGTAQNSSRILFQPYLSGERTPHNNPDLRGAFHGLSSQTDRAEMTRSILQGVAFTLVDGCEAVRFNGKNTEHIGLIGGGAQSNYWAQLIADVLGVPIARYKGSRSGAALGVARLARFAVLGGDLKSAFPKPEIDTVFEPDMANTGMYKEQLFRWRSLLENNVV